MRTLILAALAWSFTANAQTKSSGYPIEQVPFTRVQINDNFWSQRLKANREVTIPLAFRKCEETGRYQNFIKAAHPSKEHRFKGCVFDDTDVYKVIEGASYSLQTLYNPSLDHYMDSVIAIIAAGQEPDGYLYTPRTMNPSNVPWNAGKTRWIGEEAGSHELYNLGHLVEAAVAHYQATGKRSLLDIAQRFADCVCKEIGPHAGQAHITTGHEIAEMALAKLYVLTGEKKYLDEAKYLIDLRGKTGRRTDYDQTHKTVQEQDEAVGHAVRGAYLYSGIADVAALTGDSAYIRAIDKIWNDAVSKKTYITGGIGSTRPRESFGKAYDLPNLEGYNETCAAIANVYWNYRMFLLHGESKYFDVLERTLYNGLISGVSLQGDSFFYPNPLEADGKYLFNADYTQTRQPWFGCACCPSNISRFIPSMPGYVYAVKDRDVYINLFVGNTSKIEVGGKSITLNVKTEYPWNGNIDICVEKAETRDFSLLVRIPGWVRNQVLPGDLYSYVDGCTPAYKIKVNGQDVSSDLQKGYFKINRRWKKGDKISINFEMPVRTVVAHEKVKEDRGKVAVERGPVVFCAESADNGFNVRHVFFNDHTAFDVTDGESGILKGAKVIHAGSVQSVMTNENGLTTTREKKLVLVPYYLWNHRGIGNMEVWFGKTLP